MYGYDVDPGLCDEERYVTIRDLVILDKEEDEREQPDAPIGDDDDDDDDTFFNPECLDNILLINKIGVTNFQNDGIRILSQDQTSVTVKLTQSYTPSPATINYLFYQYKPDPFDTKCYEEDNDD